MQLFVGIALLVFIYVAKILVTSVVKACKVAVALGKHPMDPKHWFWGHLHLFPGHNEAGLEFIRNRTSRFPRLCSFWAINYFRGFLILHHPEVVSTLLRSSEPKQVKSGMYKYGRGWIGDGLIFSSGAKWSRNRKLLTNVFHFEILKQYFQVMNACTEVFLNNILPIAKTGKSFELFSKTSLLTFDIILRCAFSYENDVQLKGNQHPYTQAVMRLQDLWLKRTQNPWHHYDLIYWFSSDGKEFKKQADFVHNISESLIRKRKNEHLNQSLRPHKDFLDILLTSFDEDGQGLSDSEVRDEVDTFLFAGHDTTSSAICWTIYSLAENPKEQERCQRELDEVFSNRNDDALKWDDLPKLKYLTMCIKEALRLHSPVPFVGRELKNPIEFDGVIMPPGSMVSAHICALHHNPSVWPDPSKYLPNRFAPENAAKIDIYSFVPFSAGPRNCIGQNFAMDEIRVVLAKALKRFTITLDLERPTKHKTSVVMATESGMHVIFSERD